MRAILAGDRETGVTLVRMDEGLDTGPTFDTAATAIGEGETAGVLTGRLAEMGADLVRRRLADVVSGAVDATPQDASAPPPREGDR